MRFNSFRLLLFVVVEIVIFRLFIGEVNGFIARLGDVATQKLLDVRLRVQSLLEHGGLQRLLRLLDHAVAVP